MKLILPSTIMKIFVKGKGLRMKSINFPLKVVSS
jgi:hypothetical protein